MSKTRYAEAGAPLSHERYLSSPEYAELRGISGNAVTTKAALMATPEKRKLLFFLQAMSLKKGGLKEFCRLFLAMFADRIGTRTMHAAGMQPGKVYDADTTYKIQRELRIVPMSLTWDDEDGVPQKKQPEKSVAHFLEICAGKIEELEGFIIELCINPKLRFPAPGETVQATARETLAIREQFLDEETGQPLRVTEPDYHKSNLPYFQDIIGALFEYQSCYEESARANFVVTEIGGKVIEVLEFGLSVGKIVVIEGNTGIGKSTATEAFCDFHLGEVRYISLSGITHKTGLFRALAKALGVGSSLAKSSTEMQTRIEDILQRSGLMVVIDEAHNLFSSSERVYSRPELIDWLDTSLYNNRVPVGLVCTPQFALRMVRAEKHTTWNADQFRRRANRFHTLPARPTDKDIEAVAHKLLPSGCEDSINILVGYAQSSKLPFPALIDAIDTAKDLVKRAGRTQITFDDLQRSILEYCAPSAEAMARAFSAQLAGKRPGRRPSAPLQPDSSAGAAAMQSDTGNPPPPAKPSRTARKTNLTGLTHDRRTSPALVVTAERDKTLAV